MKIIRHLIEQPFIAAVALAAFFHSTWSLATLFAGLEPAQFTFSWLAWVAPHALIAFAIDMGQISTAIQIRHGARGKAKLATFGVLAASTYMLQLLYILHHVPQVALGAGVAPALRAAGQFVIDISIWFLPAMLPAGVMLYTFSDAQPTHPAQAIAPGSALVIERPDRDLEPTQLNPADFGFTAACERCEWSGIYGTDRAATNALIAHRRHCPAKLNGQAVQP